ncbi:MAG: glycosyltransferase [Chloroflexota bacterium]
MGAGGAERVTATLADAWAAQGRDVHVITLAARATDFYGLDARVHRHALDVARDTHSLPDALRTTAQRIRAIRSRLRAIDPDVVIGMTTTAGVLATLASQRSRWLVVVEEHIHPPAMPPGRPWSSSDAGPIRAPRAWWCSHPRASHGCAAPSRARGA